MAWAALKLITRFGRYAILALLIVPALIGFGWFKLLDVAPIAGLVAAVAVIPLLTASLALAIGVLVLPSGRLPRDQLSQADAPNIWAIWEQIDPSAGRRRALAIDDQLNASIYEHRGVLGLRRREVMILGLPLLMILDEAAVRAVVAHEVGHARLSHINGSANLADFIRAFDMLFHFADPERTVSGGLTLLALDGTLTALERTRRMLSRQDELEADGYAAKAVRDAMARSLVLTKAGDRALNELVYKPLERDMLGAMTPPPSPLARIAAQLDAIHARGTTEALAVPAPDEPDHVAENDKRYGSTHPTFEERLISLGFEAPPLIEPVARAASADLLPEATVRTWTETFEKRWRRRVETMFQ